MSENSFKSDVFRIVSEHLSKAYEDLKIEDSFVEDLDADSLDVIELIMAFEDEFDLEISDDEAEDLSTISSVLDYINKNLH